MKEEVLKEVYKKVLNLLLKDIEEDFVEEIKKGYYESLFERYSDIGVEKKDIENYIELEVLRLEDLNANEKKNLYIKDEYFIQLGNVSQQISDLAKRKKINSEYSVSKEELNNLKEKMLSLLPQVRDFNKEIAEQYVSEAMVEVEYLLGNEEISSFRLSHL